MSFIKKLAKGAQKAMSSVGDSVDKGKERALKHYDGTLAIPGGFCVSAVKVNLHKGKNLKT
jgi:hypothetical protein